jgi:hypothetical protein
MQSRIYDYLYPWIETLATGSLKVLLGLEHDLVSTWDESNIKFLGL